MRVMFPLMNLIITKWLLVYVLENKHNFYVIHFFSLTVQDHLGEDQHQIHQGVGQEQGLPQRVNFCKKLQ